MRAWPSALVPALCLLATAASPADAHVGKRQGLIFRDVRPVSLNWQEAKDGRDVTLCNLDPHEAKVVKAELVGFHFTRANKVRRSSKQDLRDDAVWMDVDAPGKIGRGDCPELRIEANPKPEPAAGEYEGVLIVTSAGSGRARLTVTLTVPGASEDSEETSGGLSSTTIKDLTLPGVSFVPSLVNPLGRAALSAAFLMLLVGGVFLLPGRRPSFVTPGWATVVIVVAIALGVWGALESFPSDDNDYFDGSGPHLVEMSSPLVSTSVTSGPIGDLVGPDGNLVSATVSAVHRLEIEDVERAGAYVGKVDLTPTAEGGDATLTANVRDFWVWALLVIGAGVALGTWLTRYFTTGRSGLLALIGVARLQHQVDTDPHGAELRMKARLAEIREVLDSEDPKKFEKATTLLEEARKYFDRAKGLSEKLGRLATLRESLRADVTGLGIENLVGDDTYGVQHAQRLLDEPIDSPDLDVSEDFETDVDGTLNLVGELVNLMPRVRAILQEAKDPAVRAAVETAAKDLVKVGDPDKIADAYKALGDALTPPKPGAPPKPPPAEPIARLGAGRRPSGAARFLTLAYRPFRAVHLMLSSETPADEIERRLRELDRRMGTVSFVLAVLSGLVVLYVPSSTWGSPSDYLKALLWGSVVSEGTKAVAAIVGKLSPTTA